MHSTESETRFVPDPSEHVDQVEVSDLVNVPHNSGAKPPLPALNMPISAAQSSAEIKAIGVEGAPGDPRAGPGMLWAELGAIAALVVVLAGVLAMWLGWVAGLASLGLAGLALVLNPVIGATVERARERQTVIHLHDGETKPTGEKRPRVDLVDRQAEDESFTV